MKFQISPRILSICNTCSEVIKSQIKVRHSLKYQNRHIWGWQKNYINSTVLVLNRLNQIVKVFYIVKQQIDCKNSNNFTRGHFLGGCLRTSYRHQQGDMVALNCLISDFYRHLGTVKRFPVCLHFILGRRKLFPFWLRK